MHLGGEGTGMRAQARERGLSGEKGCLCLCGGDREGIYGRGFVNIC